MSTLSRLRNEVIYIKFQRKILVFKRCMDISYLSQIYPIYPVLISELYLFYVKEKISFKKYLFLKKGDINFILFD